MKSSVSFRCQHILSRVSMIPIVSASALVSQCLLALPNISSIMLGVFFSALSFGGFLTLFLPVLNEMYALLPLGKSSTTLPSGALTPAGTADVSYMRRAVCLPGRRLLLHLARAHARPIPSRGNTARHHHLRRARLLPGLFWPCPGGTL